MYDSLWRFEMIRRLLGHQVVLTDEQLETIKADVAAAGKHAWSTLVASYLRELGNSHGLFIGAWTILHEGKEVPKAVIPEVTRGWKSIYFTTRTGRSTFTLLPDGVSVESNRQTFPERGQAVARTWLLGPAESAKWFANRNPPTAALVEAAAWLAGIGLTDKQIVELAHQPVNMAHVRKVVKHCALGAIAYKYAGLPKGPIDYRAAAFRAAMAAWHPGYWDALAEKVGRSLSRLISPNFLTVEVNDDDR